MEVKITRGAYKGHTGTVESDHGASVTVRLENGTRILVSIHAITAR